MTERIKVTLVPDGERERTTRFRGSQHFAKRGQRIRKEHRTQTAHDSIKRVVGKRQRVGRALPKFNIGQSSLDCFALSLLDHFGDRVSAHHRARRTNFLGNRDRRLAGAGGNIKHRLSVNDCGICDQRLGQGCEHLPDRCAVFGPVLCRIAPLCQRIGGLHLSHFYPPLNCLVSVLSA